MNERADLSLHAARLLRDKAARVGDKAARRQRPRARFLAELRARLTAWSVPLYAVMTALTALFAVLELALGGGGIAAALQAALAMLVGGTTFAIYVGRRS